MVIVRGNDSPCRGLHSANRCTFYSNSPGKRGIPAGEEMGNDRMRILARRLLIFLKDTSPQRPPKVAQGANALVELIQMEAFVRRVNTVIR